MIKESRNMAINRPGVIPCSSETKFCPEGYRCTEATRRICKDGYCNRDVITFCEDDCKNSDCEQNTEPSTTPITIKTTSTTSTSTKIETTTPKITLGRQTKYCCKFIFLDTRNVTIFPLNTTDQTTLMSSNISRASPWTLKDYDMLDQSLIGLYNNDHYTIIRVKSIYTDISQSCYYEAQTSRPECKFPKESNPACNFRTQYAYFTEEHNECIKKYFNNQKLKMVKQPFLYTTEAAKRHAASRGRLPMITNITTSYKSDSDGNTNDNLTPVHITSNMPEEEEEDKSNNCKFIVTERIFECRDWSSRTLLADLRKAQGCSQTCSHT